MKVFYGTRQFYKYIYPSLSFVVFEKHTYRRQRLPTGTELKELSKFDSRFLLLIMNFLNNNKP